MTIYNLDNIESKAQMFIKRNEPWLPIVPINRLNKAAEFRPETMLPQSLRSWLIDVSFRMNDCPIDYAAANCLVALSSLVGHKVAVRPKRRDKSWTVCPNLWGLVVGDPGVKKTPIQSTVLSPLFSFEKASREEFDAAMLEYHAEMQIHKLKCEAIDNSVRKALKNGNNAEADKLGHSKPAEPDAPICRRHITHDATIQVLADILDQNPQGVLQVRDEISGWLKQLEQAQNLSDRAFWLETWAGDSTFSYDRVGRGSCWINNTTVSIIGSIQPDKISPYLTDHKKGSGNDGLLERFQVVVFPDTSLTSFVDLETNIPLSEEALKTYTQLDQIPINDSPILLDFDSDAQDELDLWLKDRVHLPEREPTHMRSYIDKMASFVPSAAAIFHLCENPPSKPIGLPALCMAIEWCDYLTTHAKKLFGLAYKSPEQASAESLRSKLGQLPDPFKLDDFCRKDWSGLQTPAARRAALRCLSEARYIRPITYLSDGKKITIYYKRPPSIDILNIDQ